MIWRWHDGYLYYTQLYVESLKEKFLDKLYSMQYR